MSEGSNVTEVSICNNALAMIGGGMISDLEDDSEQARWCNNLFANLRDTLLASHPWNFAMRRGSIAADTDDPTYEYSYAYTLPPACLRVWQVGELDDDIIYKVEGRKIVTDDGAPLKIMYLSRVTDPAQFSPGFAEVLACMLAWKLSYVLKANASYTQFIFERYQDELSRARSQDAQEGTPDHIEFSDWELARWSGA